MDQPNIQFDIDEMAAGWAHFTDLHLKESLGKKQSRRATDELLQSIISEMVRSGDAVDKVITRFLQHGRMYDMGVGRGVPIGLAGSRMRNADDSEKHFRKPVKWFSKTYYAEVQRFKEIYADRFQRDIPVQVVEAFTLDVNIAL